MRNPCSLGRIRGIVPKSFTWANSVNFFKWLSQIRVTCHVTWGWRSQFRFFYKGMLKANTKFKEFSRINCAFSLLMKFVKVGLFIMFSQFIIYLLSWCLLIYFLGFRSKNGGNQNLYNCFWSSYVLKKIHRQIIYYLNIRIQYTYNT